MEKTYLYTKSFIEQKVRQLNQPLTLAPSTLAILDGQDDPPRKQINEDTINKILKKLNLQIKQQNKSILNNQSINQITNQIIKLELDKVLEVNEKLITLNFLLKPIDLPKFEINNFRQLNEIIAELPESKYLVVSDEVKEDFYIDFVKEQTEADENGNESESGSEKDKNKNKEREREQGFITSNQIKQTMSEYDLLREKLIEMNAKLNKCLSKKKYLGKIEKDLVGFDTVTLQRNMITSDSVIYGEINKTRVLIEKIFNKVNRLDDKEELFRLINKMNRE